MPTVADYYLARACQAQARNELAAAEFQRATTLRDETARRAWYGLGQVYKQMGRTSDAQAAVEKFQRLHSAAVKERAKDIEDWRKLNAAAKTAPEGVHAAQ